MAEYAASVMASTIRVTRLDATGAPVVGEDSSYVTQSFISVSMTPEYEEGDEFTQKNAAGKVCVSYKAPDTLKRVNLEVAICEPNPEFTELISGGVLLGAPGDVLGWAAPEIGEDPMPNGVAIEVWSKAMIDGKPAATNPYFHWLFPFAIMRQGGDRVIENGVLATSFEGYSVGNLAFDQGPAAPLWAFPDETHRAYAYARTATVPTGTGYQPVVAPV